MKCGYRGWIIDATQDFSLGKFFAHVRLVRALADDEMHIERDLSYFDTVDETIEVAEHWVFEWIGERDGSVDITQVGRSTPRSDIPVGTPAGRGAGCLRSH